jgi:hypothetical protein
MGLKEARMACAVAAVQPAWEEHGLIFPQAAAKHQHRRRASDCRLPSDESKTCFLRGRSGQYAAVDSERSDVVGHKGLAEEIPLSG